MIKWYRNEIKDCTWSIAENWRFLKSYEVATQELKTLGPVVGFQGRQHALVVEAGKFYRKFPKSRPKTRIDGSYRNGLAQKPHSSRWLSA